MKTFNLLITYLVLPVYWIKSQFLRAFGTEVMKDKELKRYPKHYLGFRRIKVKTHGSQPLPDTPCIYISNHQSMNDIFITIAATNRPIRFIAKKELFTNFITGTFMKMSRSYPLDRNDPRQSLTILKQAIQDVDNGYSILAFPEGTRSHSKDMLPFKEGIFAMLKRANAPLVPLYIQESFNENQKVFNVYFCEAIQPEVYHQLTTHDLSTVVRNRMQDKMNAIYNN